MNKVYPFWSVTDLRADLINKARQMATTRKQIFEKQRHPWADMDDEELLRTSSLILTDEENHIVIVRTLAPTEYGIRCLMHDPWYRNSAANQNICYNQVGFASFYLGDEAPLPAKRNDIRFS